MCGCFLFPVWKEPVRFLCNCTTARGGEVAGEPSLLFEVWNRTFLHPELLQGSDKQTRRQMSRHVEETSSLGLSPLQESRTLNLRLIHTRPILVKIFS